MDEHESDNKPSYVFTQPLQKNKFNFKQNLIGMKSDFSFPKRGVTISRGLKSPVCPNIYP